jgi:hypothetical protein
VWPALEELEQYASISKGMMQSREGQEVGAGREDAEQLRCGI